MCLCAFVLTLCIISVFPLWGLFNQSLLNIGSIACMVVCVCVLAWGAERKTLDQRLSANSKNMFFAQFFPILFPLQLFGMTMFKKQILNGIWSAQQPNAGQNKQQAHVNVSYKTCTTCGYHTLSILRCALNKTKYYVQNIGQILWNFLQLWLLQSMCRQGSTESKGKFEKKMKIQMTS